MDSPALTALIEAVTDHLAELGGRVAPTFLYRANPKHPMHRGGCLVAVPSADEARELFSRPDGYGLGRYATGYAYYPAPQGVVFDVDVKHGKDGRADIDWLSAKLGPLPATATVSTPSNGEHWYFRLPPGMTGPPQSTMGKLGRPVSDAGGKLLPTGVDVFVYHETKSFWVAGPGTVTPRGSYAWQNDLDVAELPAAWGQALIDLRPPKPPRDPATPRPDREACSLTWLRDVLAHLDPATLGHDNRFMVRAVALETRVLS